MRQGKLTLHFTLNFLFSEMAKLFDRKSREKSNKTWLKVNLKLALSSMLIRTDSGSGVQQVVKTASSLRSELI